jgi:hypothetical protein
LLGLNFKDRQQLVQFAFLAISTLLGQCHPDNHREKVILDVHLSGSFCLQTLISYMNILVYASTYLPFGNLPAKSENG